MGSTEGTDSQCSSMHSAAKSSARGSTLETEERLSGDEGSTAVQVGDDGVAACSATGKAGSGGSTTGSGAKRCGRGPPAGSGGGGGRDWRTSATGGRDAARQRRLLGVRQEPEVRKNAARSGRGRRGGGGRRHPWSCRGRRRAGASDEAPPRHAHARSMCSAEPHGVVAPRRSWRTAGHSGG
ncbi:hypothetical protein BRADI_2g08704v3 [Brachypodium distachyon]|uniref:Uncharacterized protein n=1 Tax=Brachypodium distachyon TaxID=15368 RepID=A0A2K2D7J5_BRADI|nr:hypothetical protein BRADI_2g08704v3 [Brachypodium distachyon]